MAIVKLTLNNLPSTLWNTPILNLHHPDKDLGEVGTTKVLAIRRVALRTIIMTTDGPWSEACELTFARRWDPKILEVEILEEDDA